MDQSYVGIDQSSAQLLDDPASDALQATKDMPDVEGDQLQHSAVLEHQRESTGKRPEAQMYNVSEPTGRATKKIKSNDDSEGTESKASRLPKRKVACLVGYCGTGFHGMQLNPPNKTIEGTLFDAFVECGAVSRDNANDPKKVSFLRAARTDKGVHAAVNVISLKMIIEDPALIEKVNTILPHSIRVWRILRTMKSFNPRTSCDSRIYEYLLPTSAFLPPRSCTAFDDQIQRYNSATIIEDNASQFWSQVEDSTSKLRVSEEYTNIKDDDPDVGALALDTSIPDEEKPAANAKLRRSKLIKQHIIAAKRDYRITATRLQLIRDVLGAYKGTLNFHNYTVGQTFEQASSKRIIRAFEASEPFLIAGAEWISLKVHGQSFMLHQIRKMVAMLLLVTRTGTPIERMRKNSFEKAKINIPKAPSLGLLLERPIFDVYNKRAGDMTDKENIELSAMETIVTNFKMEHIYDKIYAEEETEHTFDTFLSSLDAYGSSGQFNYLFHDNLNDKNITNKVESSSVITDIDQILGDGGESPTNPEYEG